MSVHESETTRVDGLGLWRSWKRNFKSKLLALLDLIDNSLDAAIQGVNDQKHSTSSSFVGKLHVYADEYRVQNGGSVKTTGLCIINNCIKKIRPLEKVLEVYNSSKIESGAGDIGENGVGLKQGCATLSDLSFVLVKNGSNEHIELGIIASSLQKLEGCYLPAFKFSNVKERGVPTLKEQMLILFSKPKHAGVKKCIAQYGAASHESEPDVVVGVERLCHHFDHMCTNFSDNKYVFMVLLDKVHHHQNNDYVKNAWDAQQKKTVKDLMQELEEEIPQMYLHIPESFDFIIGGKKIEFKYWQSRLVELSSFTVNVNPKIPWQSKFDHPNTYPLRIFIGFDVTRVTEPSAGKECSLYVYSRQSGRSIVYYADSRTKLGLGAGGTNFCQGLTVLIDDIGGRLPLNPTKEQIAFGEEKCGEIHKENLFDWVGSVVHFYYQFHLKKFGDRKTDLTKELSNFGDKLQKRGLKSLDDSDLTTYELSFKPIGKTIRVDKNTVEEVIGEDTLYQLKERKAKSASSTAARSKKTTNDRKRKAATMNDTEPTHSSPNVPRRSKKADVRYREAESDEEEEGEMEEEEPTARAKPAAKKDTKPAAKKKGTDTKPAAAARKAPPEQADDEIDYEYLCSQLVEKTNKQKAKIKALERQVKDLQRQIGKKENKKQKKVKREE